MVASNNDSIVRSGGKRRSREVYACDQSIQVEQETPTSKVQILTTKEYHTKKPS